MLFVVCRLLVVGWYRLLCVVSCLFVDVSFGVSSVLFAMLFCRLVSGVCCDSLGVFYLLSVYVGLLFVVRRSLVVDCCLLVIGCGCCVLSLSVVC